MNFCLVNGEIVFLTHKVEWEETLKKRNSETEEMEEIIKTRVRKFYDLEKKNTLLSELTDKEIQPIVTEYDEPSGEILQRCMGKKFNTMQEAKDFMENGVEKVTIEMLSEVLADLIGGAI